MSAVAEERLHVSIAATRTTPCPHCPEMCVPGDAITKRPEDDDFCHIACAYGADEIDADPEGHAANALHEFEVRRQALIEASILRGPVRHHARSRPRKRKARRVKA